MPQSPALPQVQGLVRPGQDTPQGSSTVESRDSPEVNLYVPQLCSQLAASSLGQDRWGVPSLSAFPIAPLQRGTCGTHP